MSSSDSDLCRQLADADISVEIVKQIGTCPACGNKNATVAPYIAKLQEPDIKGRFLCYATECDCGVEDGHVFTFEQAEAYEQAYKAAVIRARTALAAANPEKTETP